MAHADIKALFLKLPDDGAEGDHLQIGCFFIAEIATKEKSKKEIHILKRGTEK